jgi:hypothetical protein
LNHQLAFWFFAHLAKCSLAFRAKSRNPGEEQNGVATGSFDSTLFRSG